MVLFNELKVKLFLIQFYILYHTSLKKLITRFKTEKWKSAISYFYFPACEIWRPPTRVALSYACGLSKKGCKNKYTWGLQPRYCTTVKKEGQTVIDFARILIIGQLSSCKLALTSDRLIINMSIVKIFVSFSISRYRSYLNKSLESPFFKYIKVTSNVPCIAS